MSFLFSRRECSETMRLIRSQSMSSSVASEQNENEYRLVDISKTAESCFSRDESNEHIFYDNLLLPSGSGTTCVGKCQDCVSRDIVCSSRSCASRSRQTWNVLLHTDSSTKKITTKKKTWSPVMVRLDEACLKFHGFASSPPFMVIPLVWSHVLSAPKYQDAHDELLLTTKIFDNSKQGYSGKKRRLLTECRLLRRKTHAKKVAKIGCANHGVLLDFIDTVQRCIFSFPVFRHRGISHRKGRVFVDIHGVYRSTQNEKLAEIKAVSEISLRVKVSVSGSPECRIAVDRSRSYDSGVSEVLFHKWVKDAGSLTPIVAEFLPLDNCWFEPLRLSSILDSPAPLRCEVSVDFLDRKCVELRAHLVLASTARLNYASARNVVLRFPLTYFSETACELDAILENTAVTKGNIHYNFTTKQLIWSIKKLQINQRFVGLGTSLASLTGQFSDSVSSASQGLHEISEARVEMDFTMRGRTVACDIDVAEITLGLQKLGHFKTNYTSLFRVNIPVRVLK